MAGARILVDEIAQEFIRSDGSAHRVLAGCSFAIEPGEFVSIVGPSGSGKTTLFNLIAGLATAPTGVISIDGVPVAGPSRRVAYMLQKDLLMPWRTALENVTLGLEIRGIPRGIARARALGYLQRYGLGGFEGAYPATLSGGMRQRVALIRTLVLDPELVLLDEPFSALDYQTRLMLEADLLRIIRDANCTAILVTHDIDEAVAVADRVIVLGGRPAHVKLERPIVLSDAIDGGLRSPLLAREAPEFREHHHAIWAALDITLGDLAA